MHVHGLTRMLVIDAKKRVLGVISLSDIARHRSKAEVGGTLRDVNASRYAADRH